MISIAGAGNVLFASNGPVYNLNGMGNKWWVQLFRDLPEKAPAGAGFTQAEVESILYKNTRRILGTVGEN